ncbi:hypothetical protein OAI86_06620 [Alphaproteobacteria bacterium]|nr:hypothetical protein [Alphaproteobacteria bacterium]
MAQSKFKKVDIKSNKNPRLIALEIWMLIFYNHKKLEDIINNSFDFNKLDKRDKSFIYLILNTSMRRHKQVQVIYNKYANFGIKRRNRHLNSILTIATVQLIWLKIAPYAVLNDAVNQARKFGGESQSKLVNGLLRSMLDDEEQWSKLMPEEKHNLPDWLFKSWVSTYGEKNVEEIVNIAMAPPPIDIIISKRMSQKDKQELKLNLLGEEIFPNVIRCNLNGPVENLPGYLDGTWWIQDAASQIPCNLLLSKLTKYFKKKLKSLNILDLCCAPGGKTAQLLDNNLNVTSIERSRSRSEIFKDNMKRLKFNPELTIVNAEDYTPKLKPDVILIDAPCSGTGTIRKNPDIFLKPAPNSFDDLIFTQDNILKNAAKILNKNGFIMYVTCSLQKIEGERRIEKFLLEQKKFSIVPFNTDDYPMLENCITKEGFVRILPNNFNFNSKNVMDGTDGFFVSLLKMDK